METIKKIGLLFLAFFSFVCIVGGIGTLYYCQVESSNLFATGLIPVGAIYFYLLWPTLKNNGIKSRKRLDRPYVRIQKVYSTT